MQYQNANPQRQPQQGPSQYFVQPTNQIRTPQQQTEVYILLNLEQKYNTIVKCAIIQFIHLGKHYVKSSTIKLQTNSSFDVCLPCWPFGFRHVG